LAETPDDRWSREAVGLSRGARSSCVEARASLEGLVRRAVDFGTGSFESRGMPLGLETGSLWSMAAAMFAACNHQGACRLQRVNASTLGRDAHGTVRGSSRSQLTATIGQIIAS
jgi:hypothetical protein